MGEYCLVKKNFGKVMPNYNKKACDYFLAFDRKHRTEGLYGSNEYCISELGYFPDYINFKLKLIMEWDEQHHYKNGKLSRRDVLRQREIQKAFPSFKFKRIKENKNETYNRIT